MLTSNYYSILSNVASFGTALLTNSKIRTTSGSVERFYNFTDIGNYVYIERLWQYNNACLLPPNIGREMSHNMVVFGSSLEPETINDYKVTQLLSNMTFSVGGITVTYDADNKKYTITRRYIINNTSGSAQTITEYGIFGTYQTGSSRSSYCLLYRELLSEPFVIEPNETVNFDLTLTYDLPAEYIPNA